MKKFILTLVCLTGLAVSALAQDPIPAPVTTNTNSVPTTVTDTNTVTTAVTPEPNNVIIVKKIIDTLGDQMQIMGGYAFVSTAEDGWQGTPTVGVQGNLFSTELKLPFTTQTTIKPGIVYLYGIKLEKHLLGVGVCGELKKLSPRLNETKESTGIINRLPGNLELINWQIGVGSVADEAKPWVGAAVSLKW